MTVTTSPTRQFPCPSCSANLEFDPGQNRLVCPYCGTTQAIEQTSLGEVAEQTYDDFLNEQHTQIAALSQTAMEATCPGCHASVTFEPPDVAGDCPFCGTSIVAQAHTANPVITPGGILPFQFGRKDAQQKIRQWLSKRWFAPNGLKKMAQQEGIQGIYLPFWTYDCDTLSQYRGERGTYYYVTVKVNGKSRRRRKTRWRSARGSVSLFFDDILVAATKAVDTTRLKALEPWDLRPIVPYKSSYLAGFKAQRYQINLKEGFELAKSETTAKIRSAIRRDIGGDTQRIHSTQTSYQNKTFKHILLPVWMASYRFKNKRYQVMINAQTGEVLGDRPWSALKITAAVVSASLLVFSFVYGERISDALRNFRGPSLPRPTPTETVPQSPSPPPIAPSSSSPPTSSPSPLTSPSSPTSSTSTPQVEAAFQQAINLAGQASTQTQTAQSAQEWQQIANLWIQSIELLKQVPSSSPNYSTAQQKIQEYQTNLNYARQQS